jgi:hypothetical protein
MKELLLLVHPVVGVLGIFSTLWLCIELLNHNSKNLKRIRLASLAIPFFMFLTWIASGYWYVLYYAADKAIILKGPWPFAHKVIMETKEHLFFVTLVLSCVIPFVVFKDNVGNKQVRIIIYLLSAFVILTAMALEAGGSLIAMGVKLGLLQSLTR